MSEPHLDLQSAKSAQEVLQVIFKPNEICVAFCNDSLGIGDFFIFSFSYFILIINMFILSTYIYKLDDKAPPFLPRLQVS